MMKVANLVKFVGSNYLVYQVPSDIFFFFFFFYNIFENVTKRVVIRSNTVC